MYTDIHRIRTVSTTRGHTEKGANYVYPPLTPFAFPKGGQCDKVVTSPTSILGVYSRPLISSRYRFQGSPLVPKPGTLNSHSQPSPSLVQQVQIHQLWAM